MAGVRGDGDSGGKGATACLTGAWGQKLGASMFDIDREHPHYVLRKQVWRRYRDLYIGGEQLRFNAQHYLVRRQREPGDVYAERLTRVFYENYIGSIVDWYAATLFSTEPTLTFAGSEGFYAEFVGDVDRKGTELSDFWRGQFLESMIAGVSYVLVDFPRVAQKAGIGRRKTRWGLRGRIWWIIRRRTSSIGAWTSRAISSGWCCGRGDLKKDRRGRRGVADRDAVERITTSRISGFTRRATRSGGGSAGGRRPAWFSETRSRAVCSRCGFRRGCGC